MRAARRGPRGARLRLTGRRGGARSGAIGLVAAVMAMLLSTTACSPDGAQTPRSDGAASRWRVEGGPGSDLALAERYAAALAEPDPLERHMRLAAVYSRVGEADLPALLAVLKQDLRRRRPEEIRTFANLLARLDRENALREVIGWDVPHARIAAQAEVMSIWAASGAIEQARATWREAAAQQPAEVIQQGELGLIEALARHRVLPPILEILEASQDPDHRRRLIAKISLVMSQTPGIPYPDWAVQLHAEGRLGAELESEILLQALKLLLAGSVEAGTAWYERIKQADCAREALAVIGEKWAYSDPVAALEYMKTRPAPERSDLGRRAVALIWLQREPARAEPYLREAIVEDPEMHSVILPLVQYAMVRDLPGAMELAQRIPVEEERASALKQGLMRWVQLDPKAVDAYLAAHPVPDEVKQAVEGARRLRQQRIEADA